MSHTQSY